MSQWQLWLLGTIGVLAIVDLLIHLGYSLFAMRRFENRPAFFVQSPPEDGPLAEPLSIRTKDGLTLSGGAYFPAETPPRGVIVFAPETDGRYETSMNYAGALVDAGFVVIAFSFRNSGESETLSTYQATHWITQYEADDLQAVLDFVQSQPQFEGLPLGLVGISRGAGTALAVGAAHPRVQAIWAQGAYSTHSLALHYSVERIVQFVGSWGRFIPRWHIRTTLWFTFRLAEAKFGAKFIYLESLLHKWKGRPVKFVSGARDSYVPSLISQRLCQLSGHSPDQACWIVPKAKHNMERVAAPHDYDERIVQFFDQMTEPHYASPVHTASAR
ncbi:alpha/beta hydrolase [Planctomicrobium sp. SH664]|uniref:alpha/beta hydrolase n=1 Tax=Planctomicrobium sp. SH664 TaxID=3448125 RepID=UPI003F5B9BF4